MPLLPNRNGRTVESAKNRKIKSYGTLTAFSALGLALAATSSSSQTVSDMQAPSTATPAGSGAVSATKTAQTGSATTQSPAAPVLVSKPAAPPPPPPLAGTEVLIDPGHGGDDPGAISGGYQEKDITLAVSLSLRDKLTALGARVEMTRDVDKTLTLQERLDASNNSCPDVFVSVHVNAIKNPQMRGLETYYHDDRDKVLAERALNTLSVELKETPKWSHARNLFVLNGNLVPATLVEIGYLTNGDTRKLLVTKAYQDKVASALSTTLVGYFKTPHVERGCPRIVPTQSV